MMGKRVFALVVTLMTLVLAHRTDTATAKFTPIPNISDSNKPTILRQSTSSPSHRHYLPHTAWEPTKKEGVGLKEDLNLTKTQIHQGKDKVLKVRPLKRFTAHKPLQSNGAAFNITRFRTGNEETLKTLVSAMNVVPMPSFAEEPLRSRISRRRKNQKKLRLKRWYGEVSREKNLKPLVSHGTNEDTRFIKLFVVTDHSTYKKYGDFWTLVNRIKKIIQISNSYMRKVNFFLVFTGLEVWDNGNEVSAPREGSFEIDIFKSHSEKLLLKHKFDVNVYLLGNMFSKLFGRSYSGRMCSSTFANIIVADISKSATLEASNMAHELAHTLNVSNDNLHCKCPVAPEPCIMSDVFDIKSSPTHWSECSKRSMELYQAEGGGYCLLNGPTASLFGPTCGNGLVEKGEECDCGHMEYGSCSFSACCDPIKCTLRSHAVCSTGDCCNTTSCQFHDKGTMCRSLKSEKCDLLETCTGESALCPEDVYINNGHHCHAADKGAFCYKGKCENHLTQCQKLYGPDAEVADKMCYTHQNLEGQPGGSCQSHSVDNYYPPCETENVWCGTLHCAHPNESPNQMPQHMSGYHTLWTNFNNRSTKHTSFQCKWVVYDVALEFRDPGLVEDGVRCSNNSMCINSKCVKIEELNFSKCPDCQNGGRCTSKGTCDCGPNFLPPLCQHKAPRYGFRKSRLNPVGNKRNIIVASIVGICMMLALVLVIAFLTRKIIHHKNIKKQLNFSKSASTGRDSRKNKTQHCNGQSTKNTKLSPFSSPQEGRKGVKPKIMTKIPSVRIYDIGKPSLQSSTNNHLTLLPNNEYNSVADNSDINPYQSCLQTKINLDSSKKQLTASKETIYANDIMEASLTDILNIQTRLQNHHGSNEELIEKNKCIDKQNGENQKLEFPKFKYENVGNVKVLKEVTHKEDKVVYANSMGVDKSFPSSNDLPKDQELPAVRYDNVDDLISVRCPLYQSINKKHKETSSNLNVLAKNNHAIDTTSNDNHGKGSENDSLYATPMSKKKTKV